ncbi:zinc ribbon domain-containing protein [Paraburkholderia tropica]|uniref:zinc ribbon domain-containing protein n=1 Tax=Paraburkholderia tropica TaxID=92647 RepID=UPI001F27FF6E|nr:zinc ribbon domain-containing protein [Paraburkholderia tropica]
MALIKCKECGAEISDKAPACVKCGAPVKRPESKTAQALGGLIVIGLIIWIGVEIFGGSSKSSTNPASAQSTQADTCKKDDLQCLGDKGVVGAGVYCKSPIESMAKHDVKWTDGTFEMKFSRFRWKNQSAGVITYVGDKAEFQNGFGAFSPVIYECDMASDNKTVLDVRVREGRLPSS